MDSSSKIADAAMITLSKGSTSLAGLEEEFTNDDAWDGWESVIEQEVTPLANRMVQVDLGECENPLRGLMPSFAWCLDSSWNWTLREGVTETGVIVLERKRWLHLLRPFVPHLLSIKTAPPE
jgi:hypothetical protein